MKKIFLLLTIVSIISCNNSTNSKDVKLNPDTGDTLEIIKRYSSSKVKEIIKYKNNQPNSSICYIENGDSINFPKLIYLGKNNPLFLFIPINKYQNISLFFLKGFDALDTNTGVINQGKTLKSIEIKNSINIPIDNSIISGNSIIGAIRYKDLQEIYRLYKFEEKIK